MTLTEGARLGSYELQTRLGAGGMGDVWKAYDTRLQRTVAIKVLTGGTVDDAAGRVLREARAASMGRRLRRRRWWWRSGSR